MEISLSEEQALLRSSLRETLAQEVSFDRVRELEGSGSVDRDLWASLAGLGWLTLPFPEEAGGGGGSIMDLAVATEEVARSAAVVPFAEVIAAGLAVSRFGSPDSASGIVGEVLRGEQMLVPAVLDASDSFDSIDGTIDGGTFTGERRYVDFAPGADAFLIRTGSGLHHVRTDPATVQIEQLSGIARLPIANVAFSGASASLVSGMEGWTFLSRLMRLLSAVECLAFASVAAEMATEYVKNRVQFGRPLGSFQAVQHHCANMALLNHGTRFLVYEAVWALDQDVVTDEQVAMAKAWAARSAVEVTALSHQLHGGIGVTEEYDLHFFSRRAKHYGVAWGTPEECLDLVAATVTRPVDWS
jgi:alkylation response protein AidB-like acyl-CoA dehydrogenase